MSRYILIGGCQEKMDLQTFKEAVFSNETSDVRVLVCLFARNPESYDWDAVFAETQQFFQKVNSDIRYTFTCATEESFVSQVKNHDIIFFVGGDQIPLYSTLARVGNEWTEYLGDKIIIGTSAGADLLSAYNFDQQQRACAQGLGLVPWKTIVHFGADDPSMPVDWQEAKERLKKFGVDYPLMTLREGEFEIFEN